MLKVAFKGILKNRMRSLLTALGIIIGVSAVVVMVAIGEGSQARIEQEINEYNRLYGLSSNIYWELVRIAAIKYWINWDRNELFDILPLSH